MNNHEQYICRGAQSCSSFFLLFGCDLCFRCFANNICISFLPQKPYVFPCSRSPKFPRDETPGRNPGRLFLIFSNMICISVLLQITCVFLLCCKYHLFPWPWLAQISAQRNLGAPCFANAINISVFLVAQISA